MNLTELADFAWNSAVAVGPPPAPMIFILLPGGKIAPCGVFYFDDKSRAEALATASATMQEIGALAYAFVYQGWSTAPVGKDEPLPNVRARDCPDRIETLIVDCHNRTGQRITILAKIDHGKVGELILRENNVRSMGDLVNLLMGPPAGKVM